MFIPLGMQLTQKHAFWCITCQNRSSGLTPSCAKEATKIKINYKAQTLNISPIRGGHAPYPTDMTFVVSSGIQNVMIHAKFHVDRLRGFWAAGPPKVSFPILIGTTLTTVLHYRADCDVGHAHPSQQQCSIAFSHFHAIPAYLFRDTDQARYWSKSLIYLFHLHLSPYIGANHPSRSLVREI